jgi:hypothetical protein
MMAYDPIAALLGLGTENNQQTQALADSLRGRQKGAEFYGLSLDPRRQKLAQSETSAVQGAAKQAGSMRQQGLQRALQQTMQDERLAQQTEQARLEREAQDERSRLQRQNQLLLQSMKGTEKGASPGYSRKSDQESFEQTAEILTTLSSMKGQYKPGFGAPSMNYKGKEFTVPVGDILNRVERATGLGDREEGAQWWGLYESEFNIPRRRAAFGAALTSTEKPLWERATITPNMNDDYVTQRLDIQERLMRRKAEQEVIKAARSGKFGYEDIAFRYADALPNLDDILSMADNPDAYAEYRDREAEEMKAILDAQADEKTPPVEEKKQTGDYPPHWTEEDIERYEAQNG